MYISDRHQVRSEKNKDGTVTYWLMEEMHEGRWKQVDKITTDKPDLAYIKFKKKTNQLT